MAYTDIDRSSDYFNTKLYTGNGSTNAITGVGFQPDWVWTKNRIDNYSHWLFDSVRGVNEGLRTDRTDGEIDNATRQVSFDSDGFTLGNSADVNVNGNTYASWNWLAGTTSGLSGGTITPSAYSINATSGFGIYAYTGTNANGTITHGLGSAPSVIIVKNRLTSAKSWIVGHKSIGFENALYLNLTDGSTSEPNLFNSTAPTSSVFTVGTGSLINDSGDSYIAYAFAEKKGFSKFGSYTGNGNADGTFVYTGFSPSFVMHKRTDTTNNWIIQDNKRVGYNADNRILKANLNDAEQGVHEMDFVSNGFKVRTTGAGSNASGGTYIYMAFASSPFTTSTGIPTTAR